MIFLAIDKARECTTVLSGDQTFLPLGKDKTGGNNDKPES